MADTQPALRSRFRTAARSFGWCRRGAIAVELAFVAPVGIVLLMGVMEVSRAISHKMMLQAAARAGTNHSPLSELATTPKSIVQGVLYLQALIITAVAVNLLFIAVEAGPVFMGLFLQMDSG